MGNFIDKPTAYKPKGKFLDPTEYTPKGKFLELEGNKPMGIYRKGGVYEQFGPEPPVFNPYPGLTGGMVETGANQPGAALPFIGQASLGSVAGPVGGVAGALIGEDIRQRLGKIQGVQDVSDEDKARQFIGAGTNALLGEGIGFGLSAGSKFAGKFIDPAAKKSAVRIVRNIIHPTGRYAKKGKELAETALEEGLVRASPGGMINVVKERAKQVESEIEGIVSQYKGGDFNIEGAIKRVEALARKYRSLGAFEDADMVDRIKNNIIKGGNFRLPVFGDVEKGQFVMRGESPGVELPYQRPVTTPRVSTQVTPRITSMQKTAIEREVPSLAGKANYESRRLPSGQFARGRPKGRIIFGGQNRPVLSEGIPLGRPDIGREIGYGSPEDISVLNIPREGAKTQRMVTVSPKTTREILPEVKGVSRTERVQTGVKPRKLTASQIQERKRGEYRYLEGKRVAGGWRAETKAPMIATRQEFAGGLRRDLAKKIPAIQGLNKKFGNLIDLGQVIGKREGVTSRNDIMGIGDTILSALSVRDPKGLALLLGKYLWRGGKGMIAKGLYGLPQFGKGAAELMKSPFARASFANLYKSLNDET